MENNVELNKQNSQNNIISVNDLSVNEEKIIEWEVN